MIATTTGIATLRVHALAADTTRSATAKGRRGGKINVLLAVQADKERGNVANLLAHANVTLTDKNARMMDRLGKTQLEDLCLQAALHELRRGQTQHVIELLFGLKQQAQANHPSEKSIAGKYALLIFLIQC